MFNSCIAFKSRWSRIQVPGVNFLQKKEEIMELHSSAWHLISLCWVRKIAARIYLLPSKKISVAHLLMKSLQRHSGRQNMRLYLLLSDSNWGDHKSSTERQTWVKALENKKFLRHPVDGFSVCAVSSLWRSHLLCFGILKEMWRAIWVVVGLNEGRIIFSHNNQEKKVSLRGVLSVLSSIKTVGSVCVLLAIFRCQGHLNEELFLL